jgi:hypothetical protein
VAAGKIAELFVQVGQRGLEQTRSQIAGLVSAVGRVGQSFKQLAEPALRLGGLVAGALAPFAAGLRGSVEAEQFTKSLETLGRVLADRLAPYVRAATAGVQSLARWFANLSQDVRDNIAAWVAAGAAFAAALTAFGLLAAAAGALLSPLGLIIAAVAAAGAGLAYFAGVLDSNISGTERMERGLQFLSDSWIRVKGVFGAAGAFFGTVWDNVVEAFRVGVENAKRLLVWLQDNWEAVLSDMAVNTPKFLERMLKVNVEVLTNPFGAFKGIFGDPDQFRKRLTEGMQRTSKDLPALLKPNFEDPFMSAGRRVVEMWDELWKGRDFGKTALASLQKLLGGLGGLGGGKGLTFKMDVGFESMQGTFDRLQKALATPGGSVDQAQLDELKKGNELQQKMITEGIPVKGLLPAVGE